jgi:hypothetical protein
MVPRLSRKKSARDGLPLVGRRCPGNPRTIHEMLAFSIFIGRASPDRAGARPYHLQCESRPLLRATSDRAVGTRSCAIRRCTSRHPIRFCSANPRTVRARSFLTIVVIKRIGPHECSLGRVHEPFSAVRVITRLANRIIRHDEENKIL